MSAGWFVAYILLFIPTACFMAIGLVNALLWCSNWCFHRVEKYFQDRFIKKIKERMMILEAIDYDKKRATA